MDAVLDLELPELEEPIAQPDAAEPDAAKPETPEGEQSAAEPVTSLFAPDGKKLAPAVRDTLGKLKTENPEVGKLLTKAVYRVAELDREFPGGLTEVRELRDKVEEFGGITGIQEKIEGAAELTTLADQYMAGDPAFVEDMIRSSPESFALLAPIVFSKYAEVNPEAFGSSIGRVVYNDLQRNDIPLLMARMGDMIGDNPRLAQAFDQLNGYLGGFKTLAEKPVAAGKPKAAPEARPANQSAQREEDLRAREWKVERDSLQRSIVDDAYSKALAGRKPSTEDRAMIKELFATRSAAAADKLFPGWKDKAQRFIKANDKEGYLRYVKSIYARIVPETMGSAVTATMKGKAAPAAPKPGAPAANGKPAPPAVPGFKPAANEPGSFDIDYGRTSTEMLRQNRAVLKNGERVSWR
jgi:hypothetical protein